MLTNLMVSFLSSLLDLKRRRNVSYHVQTSNFWVFKLQERWGEDRISHSGFHGETCKYALDIMLSKKVTKRHSSQGLINVKYHFLWYIGIVVATE